jgi:hypothetical protein
MTAVYMGPVDGPRRALIMRRDSIRKLSSHEKTMKANTNCVRGRVLARVPIG